MILALYYMVGRTSFKFEKRLIMTVQKEELHC